MYHSTVVSARPMATKTPTGLHITISFMCHMAALWCPYRPGDGVYSPAVSMRPMVLRYFLCKPKV